VNSLNGEDFAKLLLGTKRPEGEDLLRAIAKVYRRRGDWPAALPFIRELAHHTKPENASLREMTLVGRHGNKWDRQIGQNACDALSFGKGVRKTLQSDARHKTAFYAREAEDWIPGWRAMPIELPVPPGMFPHNVSICRLGDAVLAAQRCINYYIDNTGSHLTDWCGPYSRTFLLSVDPQSLQQKVCSELDSSPVFEDHRIFGFGGQLRTISVFINEEKVPEQWAGEALPSGKLGMQHLNHGWWKKAEKNWMPYVDTGHIRYVYAVAPTIILNDDASQHSIQATKFDADHLRGSTQLIPFEDGWLGVVHEVCRNPVWAQYVHRFAWWSKTMVLEKLSQAFRFATDTEIIGRRGYQYVMGLCWHPDEKRLLMSYQIDECRPFIGAFEAREVGPLLRSDMSWQT